MTWKTSSVARLAAGLTAGAAMALAAVPAAASAATSASDWVTFDTVPAGAAVQTVTGQSDGLGGCAFDFSGSVGPSHAALRADEVAYSPSTCQSQVAYTSDGSAAPEAPDPSQAAVVDSGSVGSPLTGPTPPSLAIAVHSAGYMQSWYQDPARIKVNSVTDSTDWRWNGSCVVAPVFGGNHYTWFSGSGWSLHENNWQNNYNCGQSTSSSYAHFFNGVFCAFVDTNTYYNRNTVHGHGNGVLTGSVHAVKSGGCTGLLSFHWSLKRTLH
jgi:hypothetical protein